MSAAPTSGVLRKRQTGHWTPLGHSFVSTVAQPVKVRKPPPPVRVSGVGRKSQTGVWTPLSQSFTRPAPAKPAEHKKPAPPGDKTLEKRAAAALKAAGPPPGDKTLEKRVAAALKAGPRPANLQAGWGGNPAELEQLLSELEP